MQPVSIRFTLLALVGGWFLAGTANSAEELALQIGDQVPEFQCRDGKGELWNSRDHIGKRMLVVYFYPSDFSFCCTRQAVRYRDRLKELHDQGADVVGISGDAVAAHRQFQATHKLKFHLLSDGDGSVAKKFGVTLRAGGKAIVADQDGHELKDADGKSIIIPRAVTAVRSTFVINKEGRVIYHNTNVNAVNDSQDVLEFLRKLETK